MNKFKVILAVLFLAVLVAPKAFADGFSREGIRNTPDYVNTVTTGTGTDITAVSRPALVYGLTVYADASNTHCDLYDASTTPVNGTKPKVEGGQATQYQSTRYVYNPPVQFNTGVYIDAGAGSCIVEYR